MSATPASRDSVSVSDRPHINNCCPGAGREFRCKQDRKGITEILIKIFQNSFKFSTQNSAKRHTNIRKHAKRSETISHFSDTPPAYTLPSPHPGTVRRSIDSDACYWMLATEKLYFHDFERFTRFQAPPPASL